MRWFTSRTRRTPVVSVDAKAAIDEVKAGAVLVDVRTGLEWARGHVTGSVHIPLERVGARFRELSKGTPVVVICQSGHRSDLAARVLAKKGVEVSSVIGGMPAWRAADGPFER